MSLVRKVLAGVVVDDLAAALTWYTKVLGSPPDAVPMDGLLEWHLTGAGQLQVVVVENVRTILEKPAWGTAGASSLTLVVDSLDDQIAALRAAGIDIGPRFTTANALRTATVFDPSGNIVTFVEESTSTGVSAVAKAVEIVESVR